MSELFGPLIFEPSQWLNFSYIHDNDFLNCLDCDKRYPIKTTLRAILINHNVLHHLPNLILTKIDGQYSSNVPFRKFRSENELNKFEQISFVTKAQLLEIGRMFGFDRVGGSNDNLYVRFVELERKMVKIIIPSYQKIQINIRWFIPSLKTLNNRKPT